MVSVYGIAAAERAQWASRMIDRSGDYGAVTALSGQLGVSRQTLYEWKATGRRALEAAFAPAASAPAVRPGLERAVLTLLVEGHASVRGIRDCLAEMGFGAVRLGTIGEVVGAARGPAHGRLGRGLSELGAQARAVARQAARVAAGGRPRGSRPRADEAAHAAHLAAASAAAAALGYLGRQLRLLLGVVVLAHGRPLSAAEPAAAPAALPHVLAERAP